MFVPFITNDGPVFDAIRMVGGSLTATDVSEVKEAIQEAHDIKNDKPIFDVARELDDDENGLSQDEVDIINEGLRDARAGDARLSIPKATQETGARRIGKQGMGLLKMFEGLRLKAYVCPAGVWTIGYGSTGSHVKPGMVITEDEAEDLKRRDLVRFERAVQQNAGRCSQNEFDAMVCLAFNIGIGGFLRSSVLRHHKSGNKQKAANAFLLWNKGGGRVLRGLVRRREAERALYLS